MFKKLPTIIKKSIIQQEKVPLEMKVASPQKLFALLWLLTMLTMLTMLSMISLPSLLTLLHCFKTACLDSCCNLHHFHIIDLQSVWHKGHSRSNKNHIEAKHLEGIFVSCDYWDKTCSSRVSLAMHKGRLHKWIVWQYMVEWVWRNCCTSQRDHVQYNFLRSWFPLRQNFVRKGVKGVPPKSATFCWLKHKVLALFCSFSILLNPFSVVNFTEGPQRRTRPANHFSAKIWPAKGEGTPLWTNSK